MYGLCCILLVYYIPLSGIRVFLMFFCLWLMFISFFFPRLFSAVGDWMSPYSNLECMSEILAEIQATKITQQIAVSHRRTNLQLRHISTIGKHVKQQYLLHRVRHLYSWAMYTRKFSNVVLQKCAVVNLMYRMKAHALSSVTIC